MSDQSQDAVARARATMPPAFIYRTMRGQRVVFCISKHGFEKTVATVPPEVVTEEGLEDFVASLGYQLMYQIGIPLTTTKK